MVLPYHDNGDRTIVGGKIFSKIYTYKSINAGSVTLACNKGPWSVVYYAIPVNGQEPIRYSDGGIDYLIFPTSLSGYRLSIFAVCSIGLSLTILSKALGVMALEVCPHPHGGDLH